MNIVASWLLRVALVVFIVHGAYAWWRDHPVTDPPGVLAPAEPVQQDLVDAAPLPHGRWTLTPRARYDITARVLGREHYRFDKLARLVPVDLALGWGPMSDTRVLEPLEIDQSARFYWVHWSANPPIEPRQILIHSANLHAIPADRSVEEGLLRLRVGEVVRLTGDLVDGKREDGVYINTSLTREDTGAGACEVMLVRSLERIAVQRP